MTEEDQCATDGIEITDSFRLLSRSYLSGHHLWSARHQAELCADLESKLLAAGVPYHPEHRSYALAAILSAVASLESLVNEIYQDAYDKQVYEGSRLEGLSEHNVDLLGQLWHDTNDGRNLQTLDKYQIALLFAGKQKLDKGAILVQDVQLLIDLRNALMHFRPSTQEAVPPERFEAKLRGKFDLNPLMTGMGNPYFPDKCLGSGCAAWAWQAVKTLLDEWSDRLGISRYHELDFDILPFNPEAGQLDRKT